MPFIFCYTFLTRQIIIVVEEIHNLLNKTRLIQLFQLIEKVSPLLVIVVVNSMKALTFFFFAVWLALIPTNVYCYVTEHIDRNITQLSYILTDREHQSLPLYVEAACATFLHSVLRACRWHLFPSAADHRLQRAHPATFVVRKFSLFGRAAGE